MQHGVKERVSFAERSGVCPRCHGYMVPLIPDGSEELLVELGEWFGWRCINCGERIDPLIMANRSASQGDPRMDLRPRT